MEGTVNVGDKIYIDLGDSVVTGGELVGVVTKVTTERVWIGSRAIAFNRIVDLEVLEKA